MKAKLKTSVSLIAIVGAALFLQAASPNAKLDFEKALVLEEVEGRLEEAITLYQKIVSEAQDDALAAQAQLHIGICYEKLGREEARKAYETVLREYAEQAEQAGLARARLAALRPSGGVSVPSGGQVAVRRLLTVGGYFGLSGASVSPDGRYLAYTDWTTGDLAVFDLVTAESRRVTNKGPWSKVVEFAESFMRFSSDGKQLAYVWDKNGYTLRVTNVDGSGSRLIHPGKASGQEVYAYDWSADGKYIAALFPKGGRSTTPRGTVQITLIRVIDGSVRG
jgi:tetratricopeptide (TPR) repeat protein